MCVPFLSLPCGAVLMRDAGVRLALVLCAGGGASWATPTRFWTSYAMLSSVTHFLCCVLASRKAHHPSGFGRDATESMSRVCVRTFANDTDVRRKTTRAHAYHLHRFGGDQASSHQSAW